MSSTSPRKREGGRYPSFQERLTNGSSSRTGEFVSLAKIRYVNPCSSNEETMYRVYSAMPHRQFQDVTTPTAGVPATVPRNCLITGGRLVRIESRLTSSIAANWRSATFDHVKRLATRCSAASSF